MDQKQKEWDHLFLQVSIKSFREMKNKSFTITKKIAKHGKQAIIIIPSVLKEVIKPRMLVKIKIDVLEEER